MSNKSNPYRLDPSIPHSDIFRCVFERRLSEIQKDIIEDVKKASCYKVGKASFDVSNQFDLKGMWIVLLLLEILKQREDDETSQ